VAHAQTPKHLPEGTVVLRCQPGFDNEAQPCGCAIKWPGSEERTARDVACLSTETLLVALLTLLGSFWNWANYIDTLLFLRQLGSS